MAGINRSSFHLSTHQERLCTSIHCGRLCRSSLTRVLLFPIQELIPKNVTRRTGLKLIDTSCTDRVRTLPLPWTEPLDLLNLKGKIELRLCESDRGFVVLAFLGDRNHEALFYRTAPYSKGEFDYKEDNVDSVRKGGRMESTKCCTVS